MDEAARGPVTAARTRTRPRLPRARLLAGVAVAVALACAVGAFLVLHDEGRDEQRALSAVRADALATWTPNNAQERRHSERTVPSIQGIPARGVVERDLVVAEEELESTFADAVAAAEAAGYRVRDDGVQPQREGQWWAYLTRDSPCRCEAQIAAGSAVPTTDPRGRFVGLSIRITGWQADRS